METRKTKATAFLGTWLPTWLANAEKYLKARGGEWFATSGLTYADLAMQVSTVLGIVDLRDSVTRLLSPVFY